MGLRGGSGVAVWSSPEWVAGASRWLDDRLADAGIERTGPVEQPHVRPWSTLLTAPTTAGPVWLKACGADTASEVGLYEVLNRVVPESVLRPLALDRDRGWVLLPDGGPPLEDSGGLDDIVAGLADAMGHYGRLQRAVAPYADELVALGVTDMRPAVLPARFDTALDVVSGLLRDHTDTADHTGRAIVAELAGLRDTVTGWAAELAAAPGEPSVDHNDLHAGNVLADGRFYDWGDSVVAHPFQSALMPLVTVCAELKVTAEHPAALRVRDAYLGAFADLAPHDELVRTLELACRLGKIARTLTWYRAIRHDPHEYARAPISCLTSLSDESHVGGT